MFITRPDAQLYTASFGAGPRTFVALGGWVGSWELWAEPFTLLSRSWRTIGFDHRGAGATIALAESITVHSMVDDLFTVLDAYAVPRCVLAAESAGAAVALQAVLQQPQRFSALVVVAGLYHRERPIGADPFVAALRADFDTMLEQFVDACVPESASAAIRHWGRQIVKRSTSDAAIQLYECLYDLDLRPRLAQIQLPTLIIHSDDDLIVPLSTAESLATELPNSQLVVLSGAGHVPTITQPQAIAYAIKQFTATHSLD